MHHGNHYLLTGAGGYLGRIIKHSLMSRGNRVTGLGISGQDINIDITRPFDLDHKIDPDIIVHAAGKAHMVPKNEAEAKQFFDVNFEGTKNLCTALENLPVLPSSFIFISSVAVYGLDAGIMIAENHPLKGETPYAKSKVMAETWLREWAVENQVRLGILRLPLVAGTHPPGNLGAMINGIRSGHYLSIGKADAQKSIVWLEDIASVIPLVAQTGGIFNLTDGIHPSFRQLELAISGKLGKKRPLTVPVVIAKLLAFTGNILGARFPINSEKLKKITSTLTFDDRKACDVLNWKPSSVLDKLSAAL